MPRGSGSERGDDEFTGFSVIAVFAEIDTLPGTGVEPSICDRYRHGCAKQRCLDVRWHVVGTFGVVFVVWRIFRNHSIEMTFEILSHCRVGIFVQCQTC